MKSVFAITVCILHTTQNWIKNATDWRKKNQSYRFYNLLVKNSKLCRYLQT